MMTDDNICTPEQDSFRDPFGAADAVPLWILVPDALNDITRARRGEALGVTSGLANLDNVLGGFREGELILMGARPAVGAGITLMQMALAAAHAGERVLYFNAGRTAGCITKAFLAIEAGMAQSRTASAGLPRWRGITDEEFVLLKEAGERLAKLDILIDDSPRISADDLCDKACRDAADASPKRSIIFIDCLQHLAPEELDALEQGRGDCAPITMKLKALALSISSPVVVRTRLGREIEVRPVARKAPTLSDLRPFGTIETDADAIILLDRSLTEEEAEVEGRPARDEMQVIVAKNRGGAIGTAYLTYDPKTGTVHDRPHLYSQYL